VGVKLDIEGLDLEISGGEPGTAQIRDTETLPQLRILKVRVLEVTRIFNFKNLTELVSASGKPAIISTYHLRVIRVTKSVIVTQIPKINYHVSILRTRNKILKVEMDMLKTPNSYFKRAKNL